MTDNMYLKCGLITQSLSPVFVLLVIRHLHIGAFALLIPRFFVLLTSDPVEAIITSLVHERFGDLLIVVIGIMWVIVSFLCVPAFNAIQEEGFKDLGEKIDVIEVKRDEAASFLMTFILPLLVDELDTPQNWLSYLLVIVVVYAVLYQSNLYYQSPVLALLGYKVFTFKVSNPHYSSGMKEGVEYIGITRKRMITENASIVWKHIAEDVFLVYNNGSVVTETEIA